MAEEVIPTEDQFPISLAREALLNRHAQVFEDAALGLQCGTPRAFWQKDRTLEEETRCRTYARIAKHLHCLSWRYYTPCYDGAGYDCQRLIPGLEKKHGAWLDALEKMMTVDDNE
jgi:hypothetical protein